MAQSPLTSNQFIRLLDDRLTAVAEDTYNALPSFIPSLFNVVKSEKAWEEYFGVGNLPDIPIFNGSLDYLSMSPGFHTKIEHKEYAAGIAVTRPLVEDKRYGILDNWTKKLMQSAHRTREKTAAKMWQNAFSSAFDFQTGEEGCALCTSAHKTKSGVSTASGFSNIGTTALSKTAITTARLAHQMFRDDIGERIGFDQSWALVLPSALVDTAAEIVETMSGYEASTTSANKKNADYQRYKIIEYPYLDDVDTNNWFLVNLTSKQDQLLWLDRVLPEFADAMDFDTFQRKYSVYFRCSAGFTDWRWVYGSQVS